MDVSYIGVTNFGSRGMKNYFYVKSEHEKGGRAGGVNTYRVLPPFGALAASGRVYEYWSHHEVTNTEGKKRSFKCIEESDWQTKMIKVHCPFCDMHKQNQSQYKVHQSNGAGKEDLASFNANHVQPYQSQGKYYLNALNPEGQIGVLAIVSKSFKAFKALHEKYAKQNFDVTGVKGMWLNFTKVSQYKGDNQPVFNVDLQRDVTMENGVPTEKIREIHVLTQEIVDRMKKECFELNSMYKIITGEQILMLAQSSGPQRAALVDQIFALPERAATAPENDPTKVRIGNSDMYAVGRMEHTPTGPELITPNFNNMASTAQPLTPASAPIAQNQAVFDQATTPVNTTLQPASIGGLQPAPFTAGLTPTPNPAAAAAMSDEEFRKTFGAF